MAVVNISGNALFSTAAVNAVGTQPNAGTRLAPGFTSNKLDTNSRYLILCNHTDPSGLVAYVHQVTGATTFATGDAYLISNETILGSVLNREARVDHLSGNYYLLYVQNYGVAIMEINGFVIDVGPWEPRPLGIDAVQVNTSHNLWNPVYELRNKTATSCQVLFTRENGGLETFTLNYNLGNMRINADTVANSGIVQLATQPDFREFAEIRVYEEAGGGYTVWYANSQTYMGYVIRNAANDTTLASVTSNYSTVGNNGLSAVYHNPRQGAHVFRTSDGNWSEYSEGRIANIRYNSFLTSPTFVQNYNPLYSLNYDSTNEERQRDEILELGGDQFLQIGLGTPGNNRQPLQIRPFVDNLDGTCTYGTVTEIVGGNFGDPEAPYRPFVHQVHRVSANQVVMFYDLEGSVTNTVLNFA